MVTLFCNCASSYKTINPKTLNYISKDKSGEVTLEYKYDVLNGKYERKEIKKGVKLLAVKISNNTEEDLVFGKDIKLVYGDNSDVSIMENVDTYKVLKQSAGTYLFYLLLTPMNLYTTETRNGIQETTSSTPIGLVFGPGLAGGNLIAASSANKKFNDEILNYNIIGHTIKKGETVYGLIGVKSNTFNAIKLKINK